MTDPLTPQAMRLEQLRQIRGKAANLAQHFGGGSSYSLLCDLCDVVADLLAAPEREAAEAAVARLVANQKPLDPEAARVLHEKRWKLYTDSAPPPASVAGIPVVVDASVPPDEAHFRQGDKTLGKIVNLASQPPSPSAAGEETVAERARRCALTMAERLSEGQPVDNAIRDAEAFLLSQAATQRA